MLAVLGVLLAAVTPGGAYLASLPALAAAVGGLVAVTASRSWVRWLAVAVGGAVSVIILAPTVYLFFPALGLETGAAGALFAVMLGFTLLPVFELSLPAGAGATRPGGPAGPWRRPRRSPASSMVGGDSRPDRRRAGDHLPWPWAVR